MNVLCPKKSFRKIGVVNETYLDQVSIYLRGADHMPVQTAWSFLNIILTYWPMAAIVLLA